MARTALQFRRPPLRDRIGRFMGGLLAGAAVLAVVIVAAWRLGQDGGEADRLYAPGTPAFLALRVDEPILALIKDHEKLRLTAYEGAGGHWLIGYGHKATAEEGLEIDRAAAYALLEADLREIESIVKRRITAPIRRREFSAMIDLAYNVGPTAVINSTMLKKFNAGDRPGAADALLDWNKITVDGEKVENPNLTLRRKRARAHFLGQPIDQVRLAQRAE